MLAMLRSNVMPPSFSLLFFFNRVLTLEQAGILLAQSCSATRVVLTDHSQDVLKTLRGNIELNKVAALAEARYLDWTEGAAAVQSLASDRPPPPPPPLPPLPFIHFGGGGFEKPSGEGHGVPASMSPEVGSKPPLPFMLTCDIPMIHNGGRLRWRQTC